jgi:hypothetical protein
MKLQLNALMITAALSVLGVMPMAAQQKSETAKVPFAFNVEQLSFPAGDYTVKQINQTGVFQLYSEDRHSIFLNAPLRKSADPDKPHLTFACYGKECALAEIVLPGTGVAQGLSQHAIEKNLTHKLGMVSMISIRLAAR